MSLHLAFDLSLAPFATTPPHELAAATIDICEWADEQGFASVTFAEHHGSMDGFLPSPLQLAAAVASRTRSLVLSPVIIAPLYDPIRLAEEVAVLDVISGGRVEPVLVAGYLPSEFSMFGKHLAERVELLERCVDVLRTAWSGEPFEMGGRQCLVRPMPHQRPGPPIILGGSTTGAARRAARIGDRFHPGAPGLWSAYVEECRVVGRDPGPRERRGPGYLHVAGDLDAAWDQVAPYLRYIADRYDQWFRDGGLGEVGPYGASGQSLEMLRENQAFRIVTPTSCVKMFSASAPDTGWQFTPLAGGIPPAIAWHNLQTFAADVLPLVSKQSTLTPGA